MSQFHRNILLLCFLLPLFYDAYSLEIRVESINSLHGGLDLTMHCKSEGTDLGKQTLRNNRSGQWILNGNFRASTQLYCSFQWQNVTKGFSIYKASRDSPRKVLVWSIKQEGPCLINFHGVPLICYGWNPSD